MPWRRERVGESDLTHEEFTAIDREYQAWLEGSKARGEGSMRLHREALAQGDADTATRIENEARENEARGAGLLTQMQRA